MGDLAKEINSTFPSEQIKALINIHFTSNWIENKSNAILKPYQISVQQYNILPILRGAKEPIKVQVVKERMIEKSPNTTRLMDKLCDKGFIERFRCEDDRRVVYVNISTLGLKLLGEINMESINQIMSSLTDEESKQLNFLLDKIR